MNRRCPSGTNPYAPKLADRFGMGAGGNGVAMPLLRYFIFVGGSLLVLLFVVNAAFPTEPLPDTLTSGSDLPTVRILSERKLPDRVVFDTSAVLPGHTQAAPAVVAQAKPQPQMNTQTQVQNLAQAPSPPAAAKMSADARVREAFAQLPQEDDTVQPSMATVVVPEPKMHPARQPAKRKVAVKPRNSRPMMLVAQQPRFGGFYTW